MVAEHPKGSTARKDQSRPFGVLGDKVAEKNEEAKAWYIASPKTN